MKPMISEQCKDCGGEDCMCCEIYAEEMRPSAYEDDYPFEGHYERRHYDEDEEEKDE